jgi:hypothetical protein
VPRTDFRRRAPILPVLAPLPWRLHFLNGYQGLRSFHSLNPWLFSCHAFGVRCPRVFKLTHYQARKWYGPKSHLPEDDAFSRTVIAALAADAPLD